MTKANIIVKKNQEEVVSALSSKIESKSNEVLNNDSSGTFNIGLSGGSMAKFLCEGLPSIKTDLSRWKLFFCDERLVEAESPDSTWGLYRAGLCKVTPLKEEQFLLVNTELSPEAAAKDYQSKLVNETSMRLDLLLLGAGPDGHTCSLFPGHELMKEPAPEDGGRIVAHITDSPKPPPARVTLTLPVVNSAKCCVFAAVGQSKAEMMKQLLGIATPGTEELPARKVQPVSGELVWFLDEGAAQLLQSS